MTPPPKKALSTFGRLYPPKPHWTPAQVPDLSGKIIIVTGGNAGLGKETCRILLSKNAKVYLGARSEAKAKAAIDEIKSKTGKTDIHFLQIDLADLASVRKAAEEYQSKEQKLHVLFNNGGTMFSPVDQRTKQGYDGEFGVNLLGPWFFTTLLIPTLVATAKGQPTGTVRVIHNSSDAEESWSPPEGINWASLERTPEAHKLQEKLGDMKRYGQSKLGNVLFSNELARRYGKDGITSICVHPGAIKTDLQRHTGFFFKKFLECFILYDIDHGVITQLYAGTSEEAADFNGEVRVFMLV
ncbi:NAD-P-binding protein [Dentipellis sp. KUC8613]|nr:NAD-P-binding protein [Dentipellis sp. KUC8613]